MPKAHRQHSQDMASHKTHTSDDVRPSAHKRGYGRRWRKAREMKRHEQPICQDCLAMHGKITPATQFHHTEKLADGGELLDMSKVMGLCDSCHSKRTARGE